MATFVEAAHNPGGINTDVGQIGLYNLTGDLLGQGLGFGSMHTSAIIGGATDQYPMYPDWSLRQSVIGRMNFEYAAPLIATDMDRKAAIYEQFTGGTISIRNDPVMLAWAYNTSVDNVIRSAQNAARELSGGATTYTFDIYQNKQLGGKGMGYYAQQYLPQFSAFSPVNPLPPSPVPYNYGPRP